MGAILVGVFVNPALGGAGIVDYSTADFAAGYAGTATQVFAQLKGVVVTVLWCGIVSIILFKIVDMIVGLRVPVEAEREGLDLASHGEAAYHN
jgi:Amt family ammonium transporter